MKKREKVQVWIHAGSAQKRLFLLLKLTAARGGFWQPVTGGVEEGELPLEAARRESDEESALEFRGQPAAGYEFEFERDGRVFHETVFYREALWERKDNVKLDPNEHVEFEWVDAEEAIARVKFDSNRDGLRATLASLRR